MSLLFLRSRPSNSSSPSTRTVTPSLHASGTTGSSLSHIVWSLLCILCGHVCGAVFLTFLLTRGTTLGQSPSLAKVIEMQLKVDAVSALIRGFLNGMFISSMKLAKGSLSRSDGFYISLAGQIFPKVRMYISFILGVDVSVMYELMPSLG